MTSPAVRTLSVVIADPQPIFVEGLQQALSLGSSHYRFDIRGVAAQFSDLSPLLFQEQPNLLLLDIMLLGGEVAQSLAGLRKAYPYGRILLFTYNDDVRLLKAALRGGADGVILKSASAEEVFSAVEEILSGKTYLGPGLTLNEHMAGLGMDPTLPDTRFARKYGLTRREMEVLRYIAQVMSNKEIAQQLFISDQTVSVHRKNIMRKLKVNNTASVVKIALENHLV
ncbi:MAG: response regulator transcription factor [Saprospiraceae bacterium]|nr:response regulator transcription factor [Saprospiraceae bacterium]MDW8229394.1 response regulator transcription factor [Saprospiraceae bacterium]